MISARPELRRRGGSLPIADHGLIGDGRAWALTRSDGAVRWMRPPAFGELLLAPEQVQTSRQYYLPDTGVLVTELRCPTGLVEVTDAFTLRAGADLTEDIPAARGELLRCVRVLEGHARLRIAMRPTGPVDLDRHLGGLRLRRTPPGWELHLLADRPLDGLRTTVPVEVGEDMWLLLRWEPRTSRVHHVHPRRLLDDTVAAWRRWSASIGHDGPWAELVRRSALTLKLLGSDDHAACAAFALRRIGLPTEADSVLGRVLAVVEDGGAAQSRHDEYGEILDCAFQWAAHGGRLDDPLWTKLVALAETAGTVSRQPVPATPGNRLDTYTSAMCQVALDRAARLAARLHLAGETNRWSAQAAAIAKRILHEAWDQWQQSLTDRLGPGGGLDARLLALPLRRVILADHPRMVATARTIASRLSAGNGLVFPRLPNRSHDHHGASLVHGFWLVDNLLGQGHIDEAAARYDSLCALATPLGLLPEQIDPTDGSFLGSFPDPASHVAMISSGLALTRALHGGRPELSTRTWPG